LFSLGFSRRKLTIRDGTIRKRSSAAVENPWNPFPTRSRLAFQRCLALAQFD